MCCIFLLLQGFFNQSINTIPVSILPIFSISSFAFSSFLMFFTAAAILRQYLFPPSGFPSSLFTSASPLRWDINKWYIHRMKCCIDITMKVNEQRLLQWDYEERLVRRSGKIDRDVNASTRSALIAVVFARKASVKAESDVRIIVFLAVDNGGNTWYPIGVPYTPSTLFIISPLHQSWDQHPLKSWCNFFPPDLCSLVATSEFCNIVLLSCSHFQTLKHAGNKKNKKLEKMERERFKKLKQWRGEGKYEKGSEARTRA